MADEEVVAGIDAGDLKNEPSQVMPGVMTYVSEDAGLAIASEFYVAETDDTPVPEHLTSPVAFLAHVKAWVRRELTLRGSGHTESERASLNP